MGLEAMSAAALFMILVLILNLFSGDWLEAINMGAVKLTSDICPALPEVIVHPATLTTYSLF
ncbi:MAG: hypothetical protein BWY32_03414 [bacterium ADurb.Bin243]|nr:MAG: hypothetical protein BWY32_03414 [bacterium ADurb.Bin243]